jgi:protease inhibitor Inh
MRCGAIILTVMAVGLSGTAGLAQEAQKDVPAAAPAQDAPQSPAAPATTTMTGAWEFSNADHDKICRFNFRADASAGGSKLDIDKNCPNLFPSTKEIVAWALDNYGNLRLLDAQSNAVIELTEVESGMFDGFTPEEGRYILQTAAAAAPMRSADDMVGDWAIAVGNSKPVCTLTLANTPAGNEAFALKVKPGCDALVTRFGPTTWRMEQGGLVLLSARGQSWQFEANDANTWQRVPESSDPILLIRQ